MSKSKKKCPRRTHLPARDAMWPRLVIRHDQGSSMPGRTAYVAFAGWPGAAGTWLQRPESLTYGYWSP